MTRRLRSMARVAIVVGMAFAAGAVAAAKTKGVNASSLARQVAADVAKPVRPGGVNGQEFWNGAAKFFMYPPSFGFAAVAGAAKYRYRVEAAGRKELVFEDARPTATLAPVWSQVPVGWVTLKVEAVNAAGKTIKLAGERKFWKSAAFEPGAYPPAPWPYAESARRYFDYLWAMKNTRLLATTGAGDDNYRHNAYPTKMYAALVSALVDYAAIAPDKSKEILAVAEKGADYLISLSQGADRPLAAFPPTYRGTQYTAGKYAGQQMTIYPAYAGNAYLKLYQATRKPRFLEAAKRIAATYLRLQGADGTWTLKLREKDGGAVNPNRLFPIAVIGFLEKLHGITGERRYRDSADRAFAFIEKGPLADWNWEGQFEDVEPSKPYANLTKHPACDTAIYLLRRFPHDRKRLAQARELLRFSEDQFVCWRLPATPDLASGPLPLDDKLTGVRHWRILPGALEQYGWYVPIDASAAKMIRTYLALYRAEDKALDLAKARALGDAIVRAQAANGGAAIPTHWLDWDLNADAESWINCGIAAAASLLELDRATRKR